MTKYAWKSDKMENRKKNNISVILSSSYDSLAEGQVYTVLDVFCEKKKRGNGENCYPG